MRITNKNTGNTIIVSKKENVISFLGVQTKMKDCGYTVTGDDNIFREHIVNCLDSGIVLRYINRFLECQSIDEIRYIKLLAKKGLLENQKVIISGKPAKILHWNDSNRYLPMYVTMTAKGDWSKQKRILYGNYNITGYKDFNNKL